MENAGGKAKIIMIALVFIIIIGLLIAGLIYLIFYSKNPDSTSGSTYTENELSITKYPITTPIVW